MEAKLSLEHDQYSPQGHGWQDYEGHLYILNRRGQFGHQKHDWQDLCRRPLNIIINMEFDHNWPTDIRNILLQILNG